MSPDEFKNFIGDTIRLDPIMMDKNTSIEQLLSFYMGKNPPDRQEFIINNLKVEIDELEEARIKSQKKSVYEHRFKIKRFFSKSSSYCKMPDNRFCVP